MTVGTPIVIDLGKIDDQALDDLRSGGGQILEDIDAVMKLVRMQAGPPAGNRVFLPVVAIYRRKRSSGMPNADAAS